MCHQNGRMTHPGDLSDRELVNRAQQWRRQSLYGGSRNAGRLAREHEAEMRRRFGGGTTLSAPLTMRPLARRPRPWWRVW